MFGGLPAAGASAPALTLLDTIGDAAKDASKVRREIGDMMFLPWRRRAPGERAAHLD
jgi:hypothetical protein